MSHPHQSRRARRRRARSVAWRRRLLLGTGAVAVAGGVAWSATAATGGAPAREVPVREVAHVATAEETQAITHIADALIDSLGLADQLDAEKLITPNVVFGAKQFVEQNLPELAEAIAFVEERITALQAEAGQTLTDFDDALDDLDGDGDPEKDFHGIEGLTLDFDADITPKAATGPYDVALALDVDVAEDSPLVMALDGIKINGAEAADALDMHFGTQVTVDPQGAKKVTIPVGTDPVGTLRAGVDVAFDGEDNPLAFEAGVLAVRGTGTVTADAGIAARLKDPNNDGVLDETELADPAKLITFACVSDGAAVDLDVTTDLAGLSGTVGTITLADTSLCDGLSAPEVKLGDLGQFRSVTLGDVVNGLAQITRAVQSAQTAGDLDIPFVEEPLRDLVDASDKLVAFFVDNGFTHPDNPLATISVENAEEVGVKSLQDLMPKLATALGMSPDALNVRYQDGRVLLNVKASGDAGEKTADVELGETLTGVGITEITGEARATITPSYTIDFGLGIDVRADKAFDERFFLTNGADDAIATLDAPVKADIQFDAVASVLGVHLADSVADGPVDLLKRADATKPMVSVGLVDPDKNGTTLRELAASAALPVTGAINATVPAFDLTASAELAGVPLGAGKIGVAWTKVPDTSTLKVTASQDFLDSITQFTLDPSNPRAMITQVLTVTRDTLASMRAAVANGNATTSKPLPLIGKSVADLDPVLQKVQGVVDELIQVNDIQTMDQLQAELRKRLGEALGLKAAALAADENSLAGVEDFVSFRYLKKNGTTPAALIVDLDLGACTTDRGGREGCTVTTDALTDIPFNLDLGTGSKAGGIAGVGASGTVKVSFDARAQLSFGVELPKVTVAKPGELPTVDDPPKLFVMDDASVDLGVGASIDGTVNAALGPLQVSLGKDGTDPATARIAARFKIGTPKPAGKRLIIGSPEFTTWTTTLVPASPLTVHETDTKLAATCPPLITEAVDACAVLPVYAGDTDLGSVTFRAPDLLSPAGWQVDSGAVERNLNNEAIQWKLLVDGVRTLAQQVGEGLRSLPAGTKVPLLGTDVTAGADIVETFDAEVLGRIDQLATALASESGTTSQLKAKAEEILRLIPGIRDGKTATVRLRCVEPDLSVSDCTGQESFTKLQSLEAHVPLFYGGSTGTSAFDIGFPGLRLASKGSLDASAGIAANLAFGLDRTLGFYIPTGGAQEFGVEATASLPNNPEGADLEGDLAFLPIRMEDNNKGADVTVTAGVDLTTDRADGRLPLADLSRAQLVPTLDANATVKLGIKTLKGEKAASALPTFTTDLDLTAGVTWNGTGKPVTDATIKFDNVTVDAGSLVTDFLKPVAKTLHTYTGPLEKPIDAIRQPIPGVAEAAKLIGQDAPTWYQAFQAADRAANGPDSTGLQLIDRIIQLVDLVRALDSAQSPDGVIRLGSFIVADQKVKEPVPLTQADTLVKSFTAETGNVLGALQFEASDKLKQSTTTGGFRFPAFENPSSLFGMLLGKDVSLVTFDAGTLAVQRGFQFSYPIGPARLYIGGSAGVSGHLAAGFDTYGLRKGLEVLNDGNTANDSVWRVAEGLAHGLYIDDFDEHGNDVPEIRFDAELTAGASVGIPGLEAGAEGGVHGAAEFNLKADESGKVRYTDLAAQLKVNPNPLCFFDASASIDAFIRAYVKVPFGKATYPIVSKRIYEQDNLFSFCNTPQGGEGEEPYVNVLADVDGQGKMTFRADEAPQSISVTQTDHDSVEVSADGLLEKYDGVTSIFADLQAGDDVFDVRSSTLVPAQARLAVTACGGSGNDRITIDAGVTKLYGDGGPGCAAATEGSDSLASGAAGDLLVGGPGADDLDSGDGGDTLRGEAGDDILRGGTGNDTVEGGTGMDTTSYTDRSEAVTIDLGGTSGAAGEADTASSIEAVYGGAGSDHIGLPTSGEVRADGGAGDDTIRASTGTALILGGVGDDTVVGDFGAAQVIGDAGNDTLIDGPGAQTFLGLGGTDTVDYSAATGPVRVTIDGEAGDGPMSVPSDNIMDTDVVIGSGHADQLIGGSAAEELRGGAGADRLEGGPGSDTLLGEGGSDELVGNSGADTLRGGVERDVLDGGADSDGLHGEDGNDHLIGKEGDDKLDGGTGDDHLDGGLGADVFEGGADFDWADYSARTGELLLKKDTDSSSAATTGNDGANGGAERDDLRRSVERVTGGSNDDTMWGWEGDDVFEGLAGDDVINGQRGADTLDGGEGDDRLYDRYFNETNPVAYPDTAPDRFVGGAGNDHAYGNGGADNFDMGAGSDRAEAGGDNDVMTGGDGSDTLYGGEGHDRVDGGAANDTLSGDGGDDELRGGTSDGAEHIAGGFGADTIWNAEGGGVVYTGPSDYRSGQDLSTNTVYGYGSKTHSSYTGSGGVDIMDLGDGLNEVFPGAGDDVIEGGEGVDIVRDGAGNDTISGNGGDDQLRGGQHDDTLSGGAGHDTLEGEDGDDVLDGGEWDDLLYAGPGEDHLDGGPNADVLNGDDGFDTVTYEDRTTPVVVSDEGGAADGGVEDLGKKPGNERYRDNVSSSVEHIIGGSASDSITVSATSRAIPAVLEGGPGRDTLLTTSNLPTRFVGGPDADTLTGGGGADVFDQGGAPDGADRMTGGAGYDSVDYSDRTGSHSVTRDGVANDGAPGEGDNVAADIEEDSLDGEQFLTSPVVISEGLGKPATFSVVLTEPAAASTTLAWKTTEYTAVEGEDFLGTSGTLTIPAGAMSGTIEISVVNDRVNEWDEFAFVTVGTAPGDTDTVLLAILDDDGAGGEGPSPTGTPTGIPTDGPSDDPSGDPSDDPSGDPSGSPSVTPSNGGGNPAPPPPPTTGPGTVACATATAAAIDAANASTAADKKAAAVKKKLKKAVKAKSPKAKKLKKQLKSAQQAQAVAAQSEATAQTAQATACG